MLRPAFWDGNNLWKIRFSPTEVGSWSWQSSSADASLENSGNDYLISSFSINTENGSTVKYLERKKQRIYKLIAEPGIWRFIFKTEIIKDIKFPDIKLGEDIIFLSTLKLFEKNYFVVYFV